jgi:agmatine/peptidylarginine deiminase
VTRAAPALGVLLALAAACAAGPDRRVVAEWEPARGTLVAHPFDIPPLLLRELVGEGDLFVLVRPDSEGEAEDDLRDAGVDLRKVRLITTSTQTAWTRDYGPHTVVCRDGRVELVDADYIETPIFAADAPPVVRGQELRYPGRSPGDDRTPSDLARTLDLPCRHLGAYVTGGNFLVDGRGTAFCTRALLDENRTRIDDTELESLLRQHLGIERLIVLENTEPVGIQHVDCWLKVLDPDTLLIKRAPADHPEAAAIERNVARLASLVAASGRPYRLLRIDCPQLRGAAVPAYTNALILNDSVFVPLFGGDGDESALATWRAAMPGHRVVGIPYAGWKPFDALHCRTRAVFDAPRFAR